MGRGHRRLGEYEKVGPYCRDLSQERRLVRLNDLQLARLQHAKLDTRPAGMQQQKRRREQEGRGEEKEQELLQNAPHGHGV